jgi:hypothetical protein
MKAKSKSKTGKARGHALMIEKQAFHSYRICTRYVLVMQGLHYPGGHHSWPGLKGIISKGNAKHPAMDPIHPDSYSHLNINIKIPSIQKTRLLTTQLYPSAGAGSHP